MVSSTERKVLVVILLAFLFLVTAPYYVAHRNAGVDLVFGGFLQNPIDGNSYLAKMRQGYDGSWLFTLPYTSEPGHGTAINLYYLFLGHFARVLGVSLLLTFHVARTIGALLLGLAIYRFFSAVFIDPFARLFAVTLGLFGSGLGWLAITQGFFSGDFWVAEAYAFLSSYTNAHFPLGLALQVWLLTPLRGVNGLGRTGILKMAGAALLLSLIYPFGLAIAFAVLTGLLAWKFARRGKLRSETHRWLCVIIGGGPYAAYQFWIVRSHPLLSQWNAQNITPAPSLSDLIISFSPVLVLGLIGAGMTIRRDEPKTQFLAIWLLVGLIAIYLPFGLQRRLISGLFIPGVGLGVFALQKLIAERKRFVSSAIALLLLSIPTNLLIVAGGFQAASTQPTEIFLNVSEMRAFTWLNENATSDLVLAAPDSGLLIPAYSSARVFYGHPFETVEAEHQRGLVTAFFLGGMNAEEIAQLLSVEDVDFILFGPRERTLGSLPPLPGWQIVFGFGNTQIWAPQP